MDCFCQNECKCLVDIGNTNFTLITSNTLQQLPGECASYDEKLEECYGEYYDYDQDYSDETEDYSDETEDYSDETEDYSDETEELVSFTDGPFFSAFSDQDSSDLSFNRLDNGGGSNLSKVQTYFNLNSHSLNHIQFEFGDIIKQWGQLPQDASDSALCMSEYEIEQNESISHMYAYYKQEDYFYGFGLRIGGQNRDFGAKNCGDINLVDDSTTEEPFQQIFGSIQGFYVQEYQNTAIGFGLRIQEDLCLINQDTNIEVYAGEELVHTFFSTECEEQTAVSVTQDLDFVHSQDDSILISSQTAESGQITINQELEVNIQVHEASFVYVPSYDTLSTSQIVVSQGNDYYDCRAATIQTEKFTEADRFDKIYLTRSGSYCQSDAIQENALAYKTSTVEWVEATQIDSVTKLQSKDWSYFTLYYKENSYIAGFALADSKSSDFFGVTDSTQANYESATWYIPGSILTFYYQEDGGELAKLGLKVVENSCYFDFSQGNTLETHVNKYHEVSLFSQTTFEEWQSQCTNYELVILRYNQESVFFHGFNFNSDEITVTQWEDSTFKLNFQNVESNPTHELIELQLRLNSGVPYEVHSVFYEIYVYDLWQDSHESKYQSSHERYDEYSIQESCESSKLTICFDGQQRLTQVQLFFAECEAQNLAANQDYSECETFEELEFIDPLTHFSVSRDSSYNIIGLMFNRPGFYSYDYITYEVFTDPASWDTAQSHCQELGGNLASIHSQATNEQILELVDGEQIWIGLNDQQVEGSFTWIDGAEEVYNNWSSGEPNDYTNGEDCTVLRTSGLWNDFPCVSEEHYVCAIPVEHQRLLSFGVNDQEPEWIEVKGLIKGIFGFREGDESSFVDFGFKVDEQGEQCWPWNGNKYKYEVHEFVHGTKEELSSIILEVNSIHQVEVLQETIKEYIQSLSNLLEVEYSFELLENIDTQEQLSNPLPEFISFNQEALILTISPYESSHEGEYSLKMTLTPSLCYLKSSEFILPISVIQQPVEPEPDLEQDDLELFETEPEIYVNNAPRWIYPYEKLVIDLSDPDLLSWSFNTTQYAFDNDLEDFVTVSVDLLQGFLFLQDDNNVMRFNMNVTDLAYLERLFDSFDDRQIVVKILLTDSKNAMTRVNLPIYAPVIEKSSEQEEPVPEILIGIIDEYQSETEPSDNTDTELDGSTLDQVQDLRFAVPRVKMTMGNRGQVLLKFNRPMNFPKGLQEMINAEQTSMRRLSQQSNDENIITIEIVEAEVKEGKQIKFNWQVTNIGSKDIDIQIYFENAIEISQNEYPDRLFIRINVNRLFQDTQSFVLSEDYLHLNRSIPSQMPVNCPSCDNLQVVTETIQTTVVSATLGSFISSFFLGFSLALIWDMINFLQIYVHIPLFQVRFPANIAYVLKIFTSIASVDVYTAGDTFSEKFAFEPTVGMDPFSEEFEELGYETGSMIYNMGDLAILQFGFFLLVLVYFSLFLCSKKWASLEPKAKKYKRALCCNWPLRFLFEAYLEIVMAAFVKWKLYTYSFVSLDDTLDALFAFFWTFIVLLTPIAFALYFCNKSERLKIDPSFYAKFEQAFEGTRINSVANVLFSVVFMMRRFLLAVLIIYANKNRPTSQLFAAIHGFSFFLLYLLKSKPYDDETEKFLAIFTEICLIFFTYTVIFFGAAVADPYAKYVVGWQCTVIFSINLIAHLCTLIFSFIKDLKKKLIKMQIWCKQKNYCCYKNQIAKKSDLPYQVRLDNQNLQSQQNDASELQISSESGLSSQSKRCLNNATQSDQKILMKKAFSNYPELEKLTNLNNAPKITLKKAFSNYPEDIKDDDSSEQQNSSSVQISSSAQNLSEASKASSRASFQINFKPKANIIVNDDFLLPQQKLIPSPRLLGENMSQSSSRFGKKLEPGTIRRMQKKYSRSDPLEKKKQQSSIYPDHFKIEIEKVEDQSRVLSARSIKSPSLIESPELRKLGQSQIRNTFQINPMNLQPPVAQKRNRAHSCYKVEVNEDVKKDLEYFKQKNLPRSINKNYEHDLEQNLSIPMLQSDPFETKKTSSDSNCSDRSLGKQLRKMIDNRNKQENKRITIFAMKGPSKIVTIPAPSQKSHQSQLLSQR